MAKKFELLVFDWDGTLQDSTQTIVHAIQAAASDLQLPIPPEAKARQIIGLGLSDALHYCLPSLKPEQTPQIIERYRHHYVAREHEIALFDGVMSMLDALKVAGFALAVATGKGRSGLNRALQQSALAPYFSATRCADECFSKPHPQMLHELMEELSVPAARTLMIGDTTHDLQLALNAGVSGLAVDYGAHTTEALCALQPLACLHSVAELAQWLQRA